MDIELIAKYIKKDNPTFKVVKIDGIRNGPPTTHIIVCTHREYYLKDTDKTQNVYYDSGLLAPLDKAELEYLKLKMFHFQRAKMEELGIVTDILYNLNSLGLK
ncbi:MAG: hypothetical protein CMC55_05925 [Flavobacteriaceae bacterium]|nr:hypothetical protein [Flavobacteriaceae bacterium]|tara:strand:- start:263 stop:571 length:309 start_codon:yes stop_codon:yes gene_type:complete